MCNKNNIYMYNPIKTHLLIVMKTILGFKQNIFVIDIDSSIFYFYFYLHLYHLIISIFRLYTTEDSRNLSIIFMSW